MGEETRTVELSEARKPFVFNLGKKVKIEVWGGFNTIGGNCIIIRDGDDGIILDQGINFSIFKKYYGSFIQPHIVEDLRDIGAIPPKKVYEDASQLYISHLHLDHLGSLALPFECDVEAYLPSKSVFEKLSSFWYWSWKELLLPSEVIDIKHVSESRRVKPIQVSHSAYPSYSFLIETSEGNILYTGDLRVRSPANMIDTIENISTGLEGKGIDLLIVEGTNLSRRTTPITEEEVKSILNRVLSMYKRKHLFISAHPLDIETFFLVSNILKSKGYELVLTHTKYAELLDAQLSEVKVEGIAFYLVPLRGSRTAPPRNIEEVELKEIADRKIAFFTSITAVDDMKLLSRRGVKLQGLLQITLAGEPIEEEGRIMEARLGNWLKKFSMNSIRLHISGHYYPYEFKEILRTIKPKRLIPIHTKASRTMIELFSKYSI